jgi:NAD(P)-dependent dehydrogenase (short-subunit alcohol dehydrogenase family)
MMARFQDQAIIVTGAGTGIGAAAAKLFAAEGASVVLVGRREDKLVEVCREIGVQDRLAVVAGDVRDEQTSDEAITTAMNRFQRLDVVVNNAAINPPKPFPGTPIDEWRSVFDVILMGALRFSRSAARVMIENQIQGRIVNVTSIHGTQAEVDASAYGSAKAAVNQFSRCLAVELGQHGIRANAVAPGFVSTPMSVYEGVNELETEWFLKNYVKDRRIPLARAGRPEEIAEAIAFLASEQSSYVNGHVLVADGGLTCTF